MESIFGKVTGLSIIIVDLLDSDCILTDNGLLISKQKGIELKEHISEGKPLDSLFEAKLLTALYKYNKGK